MRAARYLGSGATADALHGQDVSAIYIKAFAAKLKGISFDPQNQQLTIPMTDPDNRGVYAATIDATTTPDGHKIYVTAIGTTADGVVFRRERAVEVLVSVRPDPEFTLLDIRYDALQANPGLLSATVRVTPRDRFPNVMLIDPATSHDIQLSATGATLTGLTTTFDGSCEVHSVGDAEGVCGAIQRCPVADGAR